MVPASLLAGTRPALAETSRVPGFARLGRSLAAAGAATLLAGLLTAGPLAARLLSGTASAGLTWLILLLVGTPWIRTGTIALVRDLGSLLLLGSASGLRTDLVSGVAATRFSIVLHRFSPHVGPLQPNLLALDPAGAALHIERTRSPAIDWDARFRA